MTKLFFAMIFILATGLQYQDYDGLDCYNGRCTANKLECNNTSCTYNPLF